MRNFINIIEAATDAAFKSRGPDFGSASLSRKTDPEEEIDFKVFGMQDDIEGLKGVLAKFPTVTYTVREPSKFFAKWTLLCRGKRHDAEAVSRAVKMARLSDTATRID